MNVPEKDCLGRGDPRHSEGFTTGDYENNTTLIRGRSITVRNVEVRACGCESYDCLGPMLALLQAEPERTVVTWNAELRKWY